METAIKLVALDVDGTLVDGEGVLLPKAAEAITRARAMGVHVVLATGRSYHAVAHLVEELGLTDPLILANGALVTEAGGKILQEEIIPPPDCRLLLNYCRDQDLSTVIITRDDLVYVYIPSEQDQERVLKDITSFGLTNQVLVRGWEELPCSGVLKFMASGKTFIHVEASMAGWPGGLKHLNYARSLPMWLEINGTGVDKAVALKVVCQRLKIAPPAVLAVGDGETDLPMLKLAGTGVLVKEGGVSVLTGKETTHFHPTPHGAAWALEKFVLSRGR